MENQEGNAWRAAMRIDVGATEPCPNMLKDLGMEVPFPPVDYAP